MKPTASVHYACYGHWTLALQQAGIHVKQHYQPNIRNTDKPDKTSRAILKANFPSIPFLPGTGDLICGSPPCIGLSQANTKAGLDHWANRNFVKAFEWVKKVAPKTFLFEITPRILTMGRPLLDEALKLTRTYNVHIQKFQIADYGSPCKRKRVYILGIRTDCPPNFGFLGELPTKPERRLRGL